jgi:hypothetical protein
MTSLLSPGGCALRVQGDRLLRQVASSMEQPGVSARRFFSLDGVGALCVTPLAFMVEHGSDIVFDYLDEEAQ